jgi:hypothetical protein
MQLDSRSVVPGSVFSHFELAHGVSEPARPGDRPRA